MKHFWYLICIIFPLHGAAQINIRTDYDNTSKEITLFLKNETNKVFKFIPTERIVYEYVSSISFLYKDKNGNILCSRERLIYDDQHYYYNIGKGQYLAPYEENRYIHKLTKWCQNNNIYAVDISVKIDARIIAKKEHGKIVKDEEKGYKTEFKKSILWE